MRHILCIFVALAAIAAPIQIRFLAVEKDVVEARLRSAPEKNTDREEKLRSLFEQAGCREDAIEEQSVKDIKAPNVICVLPGEIKSTIVVGAHFDHVERGRGIVDNWSGASMLPSLYQSLTSSKRRHTIRFIGFTGEERGLVGSHYYVGHLSKEQREAIRAMVNIDSVGLSNTKVEVTRGDATLLHALAQVAKLLNSPLDAVNVHAVGRSDSDSFQDRHVPTVAIHSITQETLSVLHSTRDQMSSIKLDDYYATYKLMAAYLAYLDGSLDQAEEAAAPK